MTDTTIDTTPAPKPDGRTRRRQRSHEAVIAACRAAFRSGDFRPSMASLAKAAGVSVRTPFQHFHSVEELYGVALDNDTKQAIVALLCRDCLYPSVYDCDRLARAVVFGKA